MTSVDNLTEDAPIGNQNYAIISYILPKEYKDLVQRPALKIRGSYRTLDECKQRAKDLDSASANDKIDINVIEVGKWGSLLFANEINDPNVSKLYTDEHLSTLMNKEIEDKDNKDQDFEQRRQHKRKLLEFDGTKERQKYLNSLEENLVSIKERINKYQSDIDEYIEAQMLITKRIEFHRNLVTDLENLKETSSVKESNEIVTHRIKVIDDEISFYRQEKERLEKKIGELENSKTAIEAYDYSKHVKANQEELEYFIKKYDDYTKLIVELTSKITVDEEKKENHSETKSLMDSIKLLQEKNLIVDGKIDLSSLKN